MAVRILLMSQVIGIDEIAIRKGQNPHLHAAGAIRDSRRPGEADI
jgi:hypothetical protein